MHGNTIYCVSGRVAPVAQGEAEADLVLRTLLPID